MGWAGFVAPLALAAAGTAPVWAAETAETMAAFRARPAVVMIGVAVGATAKVRCGGGEAVTVQPAPDTWIGSGSIIHPEGWVVTNGHVVRPYVAQNEAEYLPRLLERAVAQACPAALQGLAGDARAARIRALAADPANRAGITIEKKLQVTMSNGKAFPAEVKTFSPPAFTVVGTVKDASGAERKEYGKDVAILKFEARDLPVVRLAKDTRRLHIGQELIVLGFPGVVADHEMLSQATRFLPSVTFGRVSGMKQDVGGNRVIQTDAAIIQGNSGGPVSTLAGEVIGAATFTSLQGDQMVQGFNFLIPVETVWWAAQKAGVAPTPDSPFMRLWDEGARLYLRGRYRRALDRLQAADRFHPGFSEVERAKDEIEARLAEQPFFQRDGVWWALAVLGILAAAAAVWFGGRRALAALDRRIRRVVQEASQRLGAPPGG
jgi:S1-C subfamily serine protease